MVEKREIKIICGITGHTGPPEAEDLLLNGLSRLEYRGYSSVGITYFNTASQVKVIKKVGKVAALKECVKKTGDISHRGIGHTRWATRGGATDENAHPHRAGQVTLIHSGIIENYHQLTGEYEIQDKLASQTDSEMAAWVPNAVYEECSHDPLIAIGAFVRKLEGSHGFCILFDGWPGEIYAVHSISPLMASYTQSGAMVASDPTTLISFTKEYFVISGYHILRLAPYKIQVYDMDCSRIQPEMLEVNWNMDATMKNRFPHFMLKKIHEQPKALKSAVLPRLAGGLPDFTSGGTPDGLFTDCGQTRIIIRGTAMHAGIVAKALMEPLLRIPVTVSTTSEFQYEDPLIDKSTLMIVISRSGETIGTLATTRLAKSLGSCTLSTVNVKGSAIARESGHALYTHAGPEIVVANTKAYSVRLAALYMLYCHMALSRRRCNGADAEEFMEDLLAIIPAMESMIGQSSHVKSFVRRLVRERDTFFIGRELDYAFSLGDALELKEISYVHTEAYAAGKLKYGTIALICDNVPVIAIATRDHVFAKAISDIREVEARGAYIILPAREQAVIGGGVSDVELRIPNLEDRLTAFPITVALQLIAYYTSIGKNLDMDQPHNLAKLATVE